MPHPCPHHCPPEGGGGRGAAVLVVVLAVLAAAVAGPVIHAAEVALQIVLITAGASPQPPWWPSPWWPPYACGAASWPPGRRCG